MRRYLRMVKRLAMVGCLAGLGLAGADRGIAQQEASAPAPIQSGTAPQSLPAITPDQPGSNPNPAPSQFQAGEGQATSDTGPVAEEKVGDGKDKKAASFWEKNPPVRPLPRPGIFLVPPTGAGYYSILDLVEDNERQKPPAYPYSAVSIMPGSFFDADFRYLEKPDNDQHDIFDCLHRIHCGDCWMFSTGGEERLRYMAEEDSRLSGKDNHYYLERTRVYGDLWYGNSFRAYAEFIDARSTHQQLNPLLIDQNHGDLLNAFVDVKMFELDDKPAYVRAGRQELLLGSQRLISPLDWANTRRTFEGVRTFRQGEKFDIDAFWVQPVIPNPTNFDSVDNLENFYGIWTTYRPKKGESIDLYLLDLNQARHVAAGTGGTLGGFNTYTAGSRWAGDSHHVLWDFEGMYQWGHWSNQEVSAAAYTASAGYQFCLPMNPQFWVAYDWASGNHNPTGPEHGTFNQLFPFGHYYFGFLDLVGRQNIEDLNFQVAAYPTKWWVTVLQWHCFRLESAKDALYNAGGAVLRSDPTGASGRDVGDEIDLVMNFHIDRHQDVLVGYSKLFAEQFIRNTGAAGSPELFYVQYSLRW